MAHAVAYSPRRDATEKAVTGPFERAVEAVPHPVGELRDA
jgi:hypothetical protein